MNPTMEPTMEPTVQPTEKGTAADSRDTAISDGMPLSDEEITSQWWFWVLLIGFIVAVVVLVIMHRMSNKSDIEGRHADTLGAHTETISEGVAEPGTPGSTDF